MLKRVLFFFALIAQRYIMLGRSHATGGKNKKQLCVSHTVKMLLQSTQRSVCNQHDWCQHSLAFTMGQRVPILKRKRASFIHTGANKQKKKKKICLIWKLTCAILFQHVCRGISVENRARRYGPRRHCLILKHLTDATLKPVILDKPIEKNQKARQQALAPEHTDVI